MLRVLTVSTLFPHAARPNFGVFVEGQTLRLAARPDVDLRVVAPLGVPPFPLDRLARYRPLTAVPTQEDWKGLSTHRPRFPLLPAIGWRFNAALVARSLYRSIAALDAQGFRCDVIDAEFFHPCGVAAARVGHRLGIPVSIKARGSDIHYWGSLPLIRRQMLEAAHVASGLLAVSDALKHDMVALGMNPDKIRVHYTGVDLGRFRPAPDRDTAKARLGVSGPLAVSIGNLIPLKGHDIVIKAAAKLPNLTLLIAGHGPERDALTAQIESLALGDRVRLLGAVPHAEIPTLLGAADVLALASQREGLANVWVEALACGTPVIAPDIGSAREVIDTADAGRVVAERTPEAFSEALRVLLEAPPDQANVRRSAERFAWAHNSQALYDHLSSLKR